MNTPTFSWDDNKARSNEIKHGVSFEEAKSVFYDEAALVIPDPEHSVTEDRFVIMGMSQQMRVLVVVHCLREQNTVIRIISARRAGTKEQLPYRSRIK